MQGKGGQRSPAPSSETTADGPARAALEDRMEDGESVVTTLQSGKAVVHEGSEGTEQVQPASGGTSRAVVSDRRLYFAVETEGGPAAIEIPYRDVREVEASDGLVFSSLAVRVWNRGTYRFSPARGEDVAAAAETLEGIVQGWQRVLSALEAAREYVTELGRHVEDGDPEATDASRAAVQRELSRAGTKIDEAPRTVRGALEDRVEAVATELQRRRLRSHVTRGQDLAATGRDLTDDEAWEDAASAFLRAREHFETALSASIERGIDMVEELLAEIEALEAAQMRLAERPRNLAEEARAVAQAADDTSTAVAAWADAVAYYRAALTTAWGTRLDMAGDTEVLQWQVEWAGGNLIDARKERARELEEAADRRLSDGLTDSSRAAYRDAISHLADAASLAAELRVGEPDHLRAQQEWVEHKLDRV